MISSVTTINGKEVRLGLPVSVSDGNIIGREREMKKIMAAWIGGAADMPLAPLLIGAPGVGKNRIVYACSRISASELYIFQGHEDITAEDLICSVRISDDRERQMDYTLSPLVSAMIGGGICFIDEIGKIRPRALAPLASLLDERRYIDSNLLGERIHAHPGFRLIAATNISDLEQSRLPDFIRSRLKPMLSIGYPDRKEIDEIISSRFAACSNGRHSDLLDHFWSLWHEKHNDRPPSPRDSLQIFSYARKLADYESGGSDRSVMLAVSSHNIELNEDHISQAFSIFHDTIPGCDVR
jgi:MoxR-like ATPase